MELKIAENLKIEADIPLLNVECFQMHWKPNEHAVLFLEGYINKKISYHLEQLFHSKLTMSLEQDNKESPIFCGYIIKAERSTMAGMEKISLHVLSGSWLLDQKEASNSFQSIEKTYSETVKQAVEGSSGKVISTIGLDVKLNKPVIQFEETCWQFAKRLCSHLKGTIISDIETGRPNFWFGMRNGKEIPQFSIEEYKVRIKHNICGAMANETKFEVQSKKFYKIGDRTKFLGEKMLIVEVCGYMKQGELLFTYLLKREHVNDIIYQNKFTGLSLPGTILDVKDERIKVGLDIDNNVSTGDYYYSWYPKTGNALYAMPEIGARIQLYIPSMDERNGFITDCIPEKKNKYSYKERSLILEDGNFINLFDSLLCFSKGENQCVSLSNNTIGIGTRKQMQLSAQEKVRLQAKRINICSEDRVTIYKN